MARLLGPFIEGAINLQEALLGDPDIELDDPLEDDDPREIDDEPEQDDHGGGNVEDEGEAIDEHETVSWAHHNDHPSGLFVKGRVHASYDISGRGAYGIDQRRPIGPDNPNEAA